MIVGIDLGTSNCALAYVDPAQGANAKVHDFAVKQQVRPGEVAERPLLPSCLYLPLEPNEPLVVGESARWQGAKASNRLIASAKSWLCHPGVDRQAPILPWGAGPELPKLSPVDASAKLLETLAAAWNESHPGAPLGKQEVVITVPASFDEVARGLTVNAARKAGLEQFTLLEEPQAAFYDFTARHRAKLTEALAGVHRVLVVDVGGGTTDFTLVQVEALPEGPAMKRVAVGDHLMLGGDNMDAALARRVEEKLGGKRLTAQEWQQLTQAARVAKEALLGERPPEKQPVAIASAGSKLFGGTLSSELTRDEVEQLVTQGFFPRTGLTELPQKAARAAALQELGLPYAADAAITRHLAAFLAAHGNARPDAILLNGGVFNSPRLTEALLDAVSAWWPEAPRIPLLDHDSLDLAVARGAAYYGLARRGLGRRIGGGAARAYYVELQGGQAVCLIPRGFEEGQTLSLKERDFNLTLGRPVQFELHSTSADRVDAPGALVTLGEGFKPLPPIHTVLQSASNAQGGVKVHLDAGLTEIGTLELSCVSSVSDERWRLEFELRGASAGKRLTVTESMPARFAEAVEQVQKVFGHKPLPVGPKDVKNLLRTLEKTLGARETWRVPVLRELWSALFAGAGKRRRSDDHERVFFQLLGFSLRPGFGYPLDDWRAEQTFRFFKELVTNHQDKAVWLEFWVMWRRVSGGLTEAQQRELFDYLLPHLDPNRKKGKGVQPEGLDEMVRTAASLEHVDAAAKAKLGELVLQRLLDPATRGGPWAWALGRLGARAPLYGSGHQVVEAGTAAKWVDALLGRPLGDDVPFALVQLGRMTGDRTRDLDDEVRARMVAALTAARAPEPWLRSLTEVVQLSAADEARALGDTLPQGLSL
ncbi:MAG: hsp70 family protein [Archangiaceae bacterium]|nr:hsp70 family protein [Archangiaceae bacterium]